MSSRNMRESFASRSRSTSTDTIATSANVSGKQRRNIRRTDLLSSLRAAGRLSAFEVVATSGSSFRSRVSIRRRLRIYRTIASSSFSRMSISSSSVNIGVGGCSEDVVSLDKLLAVRLLLGGMIVLTARMTLMERLECQRWWSV